MLGSDVVQIADPVTTFEYPSTGLFAATGDRLAFVQQGSRPAGSELVFTDRAGHELDMVGPRGAYFFPRLALDGKRVAVDYTPPDATNFDVWLVDLERSTLTRFTLEDGDESHPIWSATNDAIFYFGQGLEIYLQRFPALGDKIKVSTDGGILPLWESDRRTLDYWSGDHVLTSVSLELGAEPKAGVPTALFPVRLRMIGGRSAQYLATHDRKRFLLNRVPGDRAQSPIVFVQNWRQRIARRGGG